MHGERKIDVFVTSTRETSELVVDGFSISQASTIIAAKKRYNRMKDWKQLRYLSRLFFKPEDFEAYLNKAAYFQTCVSEYPANN